jgi:hypothetical protein
MATEIFTKKNFEAVLLGTQYLPLGLDKGEWCYQIVVSGVARLEVRSSVTAGGYSDPTGENSIRVYVTDPYRKPLGEKLHRWITRTKGWQERLKETINILAHIAGQLKYCKECKSVEKFYKVKKNGPNKGRFFKRCRCADKFTWIADLDDERGGKNG